ncbi:UNVERIFIED_CONTAM: hypothetical protein GTU68_059759 [Idotea baltica]|nr:hypothetical protein [Idotea baltica]
MKSLILVALGGSFGAVSRWLLGTWVDGLTTASKFPYGILKVNVLGCLLIGLLYGLAESRNIFSPETRLFVFTGFLGSFTTFSTFGWNTFELFKAGHFGPAISNIVISVVAGLLAVWLGYAVAHRFLAAET